MAKAGNLMCFHQTRHFHVLPWEKSGEGSSRITVIYLVALLTSWIWILNNYRGGGVTD